MMAASGHTDVRRDFQLVASLVGSGGAPLTSTCAVSCGSVRQGALERGSSAGSYSYFDSNRVSQCLELNVARQRSTCALSASISAYVRSCQVCFTDHVSSTLNTTSQ